MYGTYRLVSVLLNVDNLKNVLKFYVKKLSIQSGLKSVVYSPTSRQSPFYNHLTSTNHENCPKRTFLQFFFPFPFIVDAMCSNRFQSVGKIWFVTWKRILKIRYILSKKKANWSFPPSLISANDKILKWRATLRTTLRSESKQNWRNNLLGRGFK